MNITYSLHNEKLKTLRPGDQGFTLVLNGFGLAPRAGFEIDPSTPLEFRVFLQECINKKYIKPVAYLKESEYIWDELKE